MGEISHAGDIFKQRGNVVKQRRKKGEFPNHERPAALVIAHVITPHRKTSEPADTTEISSAVAAAHAPEQVVAEESAHTSDAPQTNVTVTFGPTTATSASTGTPSSLIEQPYLRDTRVAFESIRQSQFALVRVIEKLKRESDNSSKCIGDLRAILATLELNLPKLAQ